MFVDVSTPEVNNIGLGPSWLAEQFPATWYGNLNLVLARTNEDRNIRTFFSLIKRRFRRLNIKNTSSDIKINRIYRKRCLFNIYPSITPKTHCIDKQYLHYPDVSCFRNWIRDWYVLRPFIAAQFSCMKNGKDVHRRIWSRIKFP